MLTSGSAAKTRSDDTDSEISGDDDDDNGDDDDSSRFLSTAIIDVAASPVPSSQGAAETCRGRDYGLLFY